MTESTDRERIAQTLSHCDVLEGRPRSEVQRMLGRPQPWLLAQPVGEESWETGPAGSVFVVGYDDHGRVTSATALRD